MAPMQCCDPCYARWKAALAGILDDDNQADLLCDLLPPPCSYSNEASSACSNCRTQRSVCRLPPDHISGDVHDVQVMYHYSRSLIRMTDEIENLYLAGSTRRAILAAFVARERYARIVSEEVSRLRQSLPSLTPFARAARRSFHQGILTALRDDPSDTVEEQERFPVFTIDELDPFERLSLSSADRSRYFRTTSTPGSSFDYPIALDSDDEVKQESSVGGDVRESIEAVSTPMRARVAAGAPNTVAQHYQPFDSEDWDEDEEVRDASDDDADEDDDEDEDEDGDDDEDGSDDESEWEGFDD
ncbi:unnamed protein product [Fusarium graminearum]|nr:unnamed protein product [Fusarium graminearum]